MLTQCRTAARAKQLETEERNNFDRTTLQVPGFADDPEEQRATATLVQDDQIDFLDSESRGDDYRDEFSEDEDNVFRYADGDDDTNAINLNPQPPRQ